MEAVTPGTPVHFYDTRSHAIACGVRGADNRSTKHPRQVTCGACIALMAARAGAAPMEAPADSAGAPS